MILPTSMLKTMIDQVVNIPRSNTLTIKLMIRNHSDASFSLDNTLIDLMTIDQNFADNTTDNILITVGLKATELQKLVTMQSDLFADMVFEYVDPTTGVVDLTEKPITKRYKVFIQDLSTLTKRFGANAFTNTDGSQHTTSVQAASYTSITMQLMTDTDYTTNRSTFTGMMRSMKPEDLVKYMASVMKIGKLKMEPPDNTTTYQHIAIPPEVSGFRAAFDHIQGKHGIYANGFRHYVTEDTMYVYPPFDMKSTKSPRLTILRVSENTYIGHSNYHKSHDNGDLTIISNTKLDSKTLSNTGSENDGNTKLFVRSDGMIDGQVNKADMSLVNVTASMSSTPDGSISKGSAVPRYLPPTMNLLHHASKFSETNTELMSFGWIKARIFSIYPGMPTTFVFDDKSSVLSKTGQVEKIRYTITRASKELFVCNASVVIRSDPQPVPYDL